MEKRFGDSLAKYAGCGGYASPGGSHRRARLLSPECTDEGDGPSDSCSRSCRYVRRRWCRAPFCARRCWHQRARPRNLRQNALRMPRDLPSKPLLPSAARRWSRTRVRSRRVACRHSRTTPSFSTLSGTRSFGRRTCSTGSPRASCSTPRGAPGPSRITRRARHRPRQPRRRKRLSRYPVRPRFVRRDRSRGGPEHVAPAPRSAMTRPLSSS